MPGDIGAFAELNANPLVMEFFPRLWSLGESHSALDRVQSEFTEREFAVYALETHGEFPGIVGLSVPSFEAHFTPAVEISLRLNPRFWEEASLTAATRVVLNMAFQMVLNLAGRQEARRLESIT